jgi:ABC-type transporter lipoprotein component MlaA
MKPAVPVLLLVALTVACAQPVQRRDWSDYTGPGADAFQRDSLPPPNFPDPLEPVNRSMWAFNHAAIVAVVDPLGRVYRLITPRFARDRVRDFAANMIFPRNFFANLLQGHWRAAVDETSRFAVNTTVGIGGLWDPAAHWLGIDAAPEDFGQVFATWGWRPSTFLMLPILGPSSVRDGIGLVPDALLDPATYFLPLGARVALNFNDLADSIPDYRRFAASSPDVYDDSRLLWTLVREERIEEPQVFDRGENTGATQTLEAAFLGPRDLGFGSRLAWREVAMSTTGRVLPYSYRLQPGRAPLVFLVPGLGAHRLGSSAIALAEMAWERGFSVAVVSSAMNPEFIERGGSAPVPGHGPADAQDVHIALDAIDRDLATRFPGRVAGRAYLGYSLGAFHGFFIAADESAAARARVQFDRFLLLDPPVRLRYGMERLDGFFQAPLAHPTPEAEVRRILLKAVAVARRAQELQLGVGTYNRVGSTALGSGTITPTMELPFSNEEAQFLIGLAFRRTLQALLWASQEREDLGVLLTERRPLRRLPAYLEIGDYSFEMYLFAFVLPYYRDRLGTVSSADELVAENDLRAIAEGLRGHPKVHVFANKNDAGLRGCESLVAA